MTDDIPDRLRTLAGDHETSAKATQMGVTTDEMGDLLSRRDQRTLAGLPDAWRRAELRSWLDRGLTPRPTRLAVLPPATWWPRRASSWRDFERDCTCNPGPVPVEGGFVWRHCSCGNFEEETR